MSTRPSADLELIVYGATGRMGQQVIRLAEEQKVFNAVHPVKRFSDFKSKGDVIIDFSLPEALDALVEYATKNKIPVVSGTTGLGAEQMERLRELSKITPVLWAPNMSLGVTLISKFLEGLSILSDWKFEIQETHHIHKKDKPSGTALRLKESIEKAIGKAIPVPESIREGEVIGDHVVKITGPFEEITLEHRATDRRIFAQGAIRAAVWLTEQPPGFYSLQNMIDFTAQGG